MERFDDREDWPREKLYLQFFAQSNLPKDLVFELWDEIATTLRLPAGKLRPTDRFDRELAPLKGWEFDDDIVELHWVAERRLKKMGLNQDHANFQTLRDYVEFFCRLELSKRDN